MNRLSVDCDCRAADGRSLVNCMKSRNGLHTLEHAEDIGLGSRAYTIISLNH